MIDDFNVLYELVVPAVLYSSCARSNVQREVRGDF